MASEPKTAPKKSGRVRKFAILLTTHTFVGLAGLAVGMYTNIAQSFRKAAISDAVNTALRPEGQICAGVNPRTGKKVTVSVIEDRAFRVRFSNITVLVLPEGETIPTRIAYHRGWTEGEATFKNRVTKEAFKMCGKTAPQF